MLDFLSILDENLFYFINHTLSNPLFDRFFPFITEVKHWYLVYVILWMILFFKGGRLGKVTAVISLLLITASDQISSSFIKNLIERTRPCNELPDVNILVFCSGSFSMPSSHAVNNFAIATFFARTFPKYRYLLYSVASVMALSRPYVGVHYPSDIIAGALLGIILGYLFSKLALIVLNYLEKNIIKSISK